MCIGSFAQLLAEPRNLPDPRSRSRGSDTILVENKHARNQSSTAAIVYSAVNMQRVRTTSDGGCLPDKGVSCLGAGGEVKSDNSEEEPCSCITCPLVIKHQSNLNHPSVYPINRPSWQHGPGEDSRVAIRSHADSDLHADKQLLGQESAGHKCSYQTHVYPITNPATGRDTDGIMCAKPEIVHPSSHPP